MGREHLTTDDAVRGRRRSLWRDRRGGTAIEYGLILSLVVLTMIVAFVELAHVTTGIWNNVNTKVTTASSQ